MRAIRDPIPLSIRASFRNPSPTKEEEWMLGLRLCRHEKYLYQNGYRSHLKNIKPEGSRRVEEPSFRPPSL